jgi:hypothetical protein
MSENASVLAARSNIPTNGRNAGVPLVAVDGNTPAEQQRLVDAGERGVDDLPWDVGSVIGNDEV